MRPSTPCAVWRGALLLLLLATPARAGTLALGDAVHTAMAHAPAGRIADLQAQRAQDAAAWAGSSLWPSASVTSRAGYSNRLDETLDTVDADGEEHEYGLASLGAQDGWFSVYVHQMLFDLAAWNGIQRAELEAEIAAIVAERQRDDLALQTVGAFAAVLRCQDMLAASERQLEGLSRLAQRAATLSQSGRCLPAESAEVDLYRSETALARSAWLDELARARRVLASRLGVDDFDGELARPTIAAVSDTASVATIDVAAAPELRILDVQRRIAELGVRTARAGKYPTVAIGAGYTHYGAKRFDNFDDEMRVGIDFRMPVFEGHRVGHAVAGATKDSEIARLRQEDVLRDKQLQIDEATARWRTALQRLPLASQRQRLAEERVRLSELELEADRGSVGIAVATRRELDVVTREATEAAYAPLLAWAQLLNHAGLLRQRLDPPSPSD